MPRVSSVIGTISTTTSADGRTRGRSTMPCTPSRAVRATFTTSHSKPLSRSSIARPMSPYPTISTVLSASDSLRSGRHSPRSWARTKPGIPRSDARVSVRTSSAVDALWIPRPLHSSTPSGTAGRMSSTPAVMVCTTLSAGILPSRSACGTVDMYAGT